MLFSAKKFSGLGIDTEGNFLPPLRWLFFAPDIRACENPLYVRFFFDRQREYVRADLSNTGSPLKPGWLVSPTTSGFAADLLQASRIFDGL